MGTPGERFRGSWICPTENDARRFYESLPGVNRSRRAVVVILGPTAVVLLVHYRSVPALAVVGSGLVVSALIDRATRDRVSGMYGGLLIAGTFTVVLSLGAAVSGGVRSPVLPWLIVPVNMLAARYRRAVVVGAVAAAALIGTAACVGAELAGTTAVPPWWLTALATLSLAVAMGAVSLTLQNAEITHRQEATSDALTGLLNRRAWTYQFPWLTEEPGRRGEDVAVLLCDLDHFKAVNDTHGHAAGDEILRHVAGVLGSCVRSGDQVFRFGGEEFVVLLPGAGTDTAVAIAERVRRTLATTATEAPSVTVSIGVAVAPARGADEHELRERADAALYAAKAAGRDRVVVAQPPR